MSEILKAKPASTVVLLRDTPAGMETLLLKRNKALIFAGGFWVFPGGSVDEEDLDQADGDLEAATRVAAVREAKEECGLEPNLEDMVQLSHWTTPVGEPRRFLTWFYAAPLAADDRVVIDGGEIHDSMWITVDNAIEQHEAGELGLLPPTYVTLLHLSNYATIADMVEAERHTTPHEVFPVFGDDNGQAAVMYRGDAGYESGDATASGARHRVYLKDSRWWYVHQGVNDKYPPLIA